MTPRELQALFDQFNARYFGGRLPRVRLRGNGRWRENRHLGHHRIRDGSIVLRKDLPARMVRQGLLHEMVHLKLCRLPSAKPTEPNLDGHGTAFVRELRRLARRGAPGMGDQHLRYLYELSRDHYCARFRRRHPAGEMRKAWPVLRRLLDLHASEKQAVHAIWRLNRRELDVVARQRITRRGYHGHIRARIEAVEAALGPKVAKKLLA
jgi:hypothetical protein